LSKSKILSALPKKWACLNSYLKGVNKDPLYFPPEWVYFLRPVGPREIKDMREGNIVGLY